ncbi:MAG: tRNA epoxyqueuosine(34) reductase QueG [Planctomycetota bacterium]
MSPPELTKRLKTRAAGLGFTLSGAAPAVTPAGASRLDEWLAAGYAGQMHYLEDRRDAYHDPRRVLEGARSVLMLGLPYPTAEPALANPGQGRVSRYAWGELDYHTVIRDKLHSLADELRRLAPAAATRCVVDTAPLLERDFARLAGLGWIGKNTLLIASPASYDPASGGPAGSYFFLAGLLTDAELAYDQPTEAGHCGTCTACLDACPTAAFPEPHVVDARRCISYLTIELRDPMPGELREGVGDWLFGCDVCQQVCPWNRKAGPKGDSAFEPIAGMNPVDLPPLFEMDEDAFRERFRHTPLWRSHREGLLRNAAIVLGNRPTDEALPALIRGLDDRHPVVRGACAWALRRYRAPEAAAAIARRGAVETDPAVLAELAGDAVDHAGGRGPK